MQKNFAVYRSSAGSGKTFTLVKEYLKLVLSVSDYYKFKSILAITFTNKAADEMKQRVVSALKELCDDDNKNENKLLSSLNDELGLDKETISKRAEKILTAILHNYSDFSISTIDSFINKIIRSFANDLKIGFNFEVELNIDIILSNVVDMLINKAGSDENITKILIDFIETKADSEKSWSIENNLMEFSKNLFKEDTYYHIKNIKELSIDDFIKIKNILSSKTKEFETEIHKFGKSAIDLINSTNLDYKDFSNGEKGLPKYFDKLTKFDGDIDVLIPKSFAKAAIDDDKWYTAKTTTDIKSKIDSIKNELTIIYNQAQDFINKEKSDYVLFQLINQNIYELAVLNEIEKLVEDYKKQTNKIHISEFNKIISGIVLNEPAPFIFERIGTRYQHFLIDEFQDTSIMQWQNFLPLVENSLSTSNLNLIVGDGKQAIYRWRNGEVEQFSNLPNIFKPQSEVIAEKEIILKENFNLQVLDKNWRSKKEIIDFNNDFFTKSSELLENKYKSIYDDVSQKSKENNEGGYVSIDILESNTYNENTLNIILKSIYECIEDGYKYCDIAILCRNNNKASLIARTLLENNINVVSSESLLISSSPEVCFVVSFMKFVLNQKNNITKAEIIEFLNDKKIIKLDTDDYSKSFKTIVNSEFVEFINFFNKNNIDINILELLNLSIFDVTEKIIDTFGFNKIANTYLQFFLDLVHDYSIKFNNNISDFLNWWENEKNKKSVIIPESIDAVRVMTIHKSKGLQFPIVLLPFADWATNNLSDYTWLNIDKPDISKLNTVLISLNKKLEHTEFADVYKDEYNKTLLDELNVLYVAMTRPEERLYIFTTKKHDNSRYIADIFKKYLTAKGDFNESQSHYEYGIKIKNLNSNIKNNSEPIKLKSFIYNDWRNRVLLRKNAPETWSDESFDKQKLGILFHKAISKIESLDDIEIAVNSISSDIFLTEATKSKLIIDLNKLINSEDIKPYFEKGFLIKSEKEIIKNGKSYRPDRVLIKEDSTIVIDFKTGKEDDKHLQQINQYADLLAELGYSNIEKVLIYLEEIKVVKC